MDRRRNRMIAEGKTVAEDAARRYAGRFDRPNKTTYGGDKCRR